jgi:hypothetical protein
MSNSLSVRHDYGHDLRVRAGDVELARYVYADDTPAVEAPKPYFHPVRTLSGAVVTAYRPHDHRWHKGVAMTLSQVSGQNFWGGPTFVRDRGYVQLDNVGRMRHDTFEHIDVGPDRLRFVQRLSWLASTGEAWLDERRTVRIHGVEPGQGHWILDFATCLTNVRTKPIYIGSPTTAGRELAGYGGLFWRGPRGWTGGEIHTAGCAGPDAMGTTSPWLAYVGRHDEHDGGGTLLLLNAGVARNARSAKHHWFVRNDPFPAVNPAPAFFDELTIEPGAALDLAYRLVIGDEMWSRDRIERVAKELAP